MKIIYVFVIVSLSLGCNKGAKQEHLSVEEPYAEQTNNNNTEPTINDLKQNGDYSSLFNSPDCKVITAEEISTALGVSFLDMDGNGLCSFKSELPNDKTWYLNIVRNDMSKNDIEVEIQNFKPDESGQLILQMSDSGDTYLCNQHMNGYLSIYNPNYNGSILIRYGSVAESRGFTKEERLEHRDLAFKLANTLLTKHQK